MPPKPERPPKRGTPEWIQRKIAERRERFARKREKARSTPSATPKPRKRLPRQSPGRRRLDAIYTVLRLLFLRRHPLCEACGALKPGTKPRAATEVHHKQGRGKFYLAVETWLAVCSGCHRWITDNGKAAERLGLLVRVYEKH
jgi:hypothetical protein